MIHTAEADNSPSLSRHRSLGLGEWTAALAVALVVAGLTLIPYWLGYAAAPPESVFTGILMNPEDTQTYFAKMLAGYEGSWFYLIPFTPEKPDPAFIGIFYITLGRLARLSGLSLEWMWHLARVTCGIILLLTTFGFVSRFFAGRQGRWTAYLLAVFGSGWGWLLFLAGKPYWLDAFPVDFKMPEAHLFFTTLTFPHISLTTALLMVGFWFTLKALGLQGDDAGPGRRWGYAVVAGLAHLAAGLLHPLLIYLIVTAGSLIWLSLALAARRILWREGVLLAVTFLVPAPLYAYYAYSLAVNEVLRGWDAQRAGTLSPPWPHYLVAYGPMLLLGLLFAWRGRPSRAYRSLSPLWVWVAAAALLVYAPLSSQRRFVQGVHVPLSILATAGLLLVVLPWLSRRRFFRALAARPRYSSQGLQRLLIVLFLTFMSLSNAYVLASASVSAVREQPYPLFRPAEEIVATAWLRRNSPGEAVVLGAYQTGNYVAAHAGRRVVLGHWAETIDSETKEREVAEFFAGETADSRRRSLLERYGVSHVWFGPQEQALGSFDPEQAGYLEPVFSHETITIYAVRPFP